MRALRAFEFFRAHDFILWLLFKKSYLWFFMLFVVFRGNKNTAVLLVIYTSSASDRAVFSSDDDVFPHQLQRWLLKCRESDSV